MALDLDALVAPLSEEEPSGPDLYADPNRQLIEQAFERSISEGGTSADDVDWSDIVKKITEQAGQTRDLWLAVYLMRAAVLSERFALLVEAAEFLARLVEDRWDDVHPQLEELGFIGRKGPCESLTRVGEFIGPLLRLPIVSHERFGQFCAEDLKRFAEEGGAAENFGMFRATIEASSVDDLRDTAAQINSLIEALHRTDQILTANAEGDTSTNFEATYEALEVIRKGFHGALPPGMLSDEEEEDEAAGGGDDAAGPDAGAAASGSVADGPAFSGSIRNRDDVRRALDAVCKYYQAVEPSSPVPYVLRRARIWIDLDFMDVLRDIAPDSIPAASHLLKSAQAGGGSESEAGAWSAPAVADSAGGDAGGSGGADDADPWSSSGGGSDDGW
jgi:type VI secretion system protein ImpA